MPEIEKDMHDIMTCAAFVFGASKHRFSDGNKDDDDMYLGNYIEGIHECLALRSRIEAYERTVYLALQEEDVPLDCLQGGADPQTSALQDDMMEQLISGFDRLTRTSSSLPKLAGVTNLICDQFVRKVAFQFSLAIRYVFGPEDYDGAAKRCIEIAAAWRLDEEEVAHWYDENVKPVLRGAAEEASQIASNDYAANVYGLTSKSFGDQIQYRELFVMAFQGEFLTFIDAWERLAPVDPNIQYDGVPLIDWAARGGKKNTVKFLADKGATSAGKTDLPKPNFEFDLNAVDQNNASDMEAEVRVIQTLSLFAGIGAGHLSEEQLEWLIDSEGFIRFCLRAKPAWRALIEGEDPDEVQKLLPYAIEHGTSAMLGAAFGAPSWVQEILDERRSAETIEKFEAEFAARLTDELDQIIASYFAWRMMTIDRPPADGEMTAYMIMLAAWSGGDVNVELITMHLALIDRLIVGLLGFDALPVELS